MKQKLFNFLQKNQSLDLFYLKGQYRHDQQGMESESERSRLQHWCTLYLILKNINGFIKNSCKDDDGINQPLKYICLRCF